MKPKRKPKHSNETLEMTLAGRKVILQQDAPQKQSARAPFWDAAQRLAKRINRRRRKSGFSVDEEIFFHRLEFCRRLNEPDNRRILRAVEIGNSRFLIRLAKTVKKPVRNPLKAFSPVEQFLLENWPSLHNLTDSELLVAVVRWLNTSGLHPNSVSDDSLKKARQRLGLSK